MSTDFASQITDNAIKFIVCWCIERVVQQHTKHNTQSGSKTTQITQKMKTQKH